MKDIHPIMAQALKPFAPPTPDETKLSADLHDKLGMVVEPEYFGNGIGLSQEHNCIVITTDYGYGKFMHIPSDLLRAINEYAVKIGWQCD